jgi:hypothetical protein
MLHLFIDICLARLVVEDMVEVVDVVLILILKLNLERTQHSHHLLCLLKCDLALVIGFVVLLQNGSHSHKDPDVAFELQILIQQMLLIDGVVVDFPILQ